MRVLIALLLLISVARAESPVEKEARERYAAANKLFDVARYEQALVEYRRSYELSGYPAILHKIALCHDQLGHVDEAIEYYEKYLQADDRENPRRAGIEARIAKLKEAKAVPPLPAPPAEAQATPTPTPTPTSTSTSTLPVYKRWWPWTIAVVAAGGLAVGLGFGLAPSPSPGTAPGFDPTLGRIGPGR